MEEIGEIFEKFGETFRVRMRILYPAMNSSKFEDAEKCKDEIIAIKDYALHRAKQLGYIAEETHSNIQDILDNDGYIFTMLATGDSNDSGKFPEDCNPQSKDNKHEKNAIFTNEFVRYCDSCKDAKLKQTLTNIKDKILKGELVIHFIVKDNKK